MEPVMCATSPCSTDFVHIIHMKKLLELCTVSLLPALHVHRCMHIFLVTDLKACSTDSMDSGVQAEARAMCGEAGFAAILADARVEAVVLVLPPSIALEV